MTPYTFRQDHGDPATWSTAQFEQYLSRCDNTQMVMRKLENAAAFMQENPGASSAEILAAYQAGA
ncbi:hypothetical protein [Streptomyces sp. NPDC006638]|uniref:hypothetical protein n=1 Tax=Streptomyces sp. NPDC006638 TaxID=3157183 RepID=UPI0033A0E5A9